MASRNTIQRLEVEKIAEHQSVRGRGGTTAVMHETHWTGLSGPSWEREKDLQLFRHEMSRYWAGTPNQHRQIIVCTAACELVLHNGNFLGVTASVSWCPATAAFCTQNGSAATAPRCFPTQPTFGTRATTVCGGSRISARARLRMGGIWSLFGSPATYQASSFSLSLIHI